MSETDGNALERGRERMRRGGLFAPKEDRELLAAAQSKGFDPDHHTVDARIERRMLMNYGPEWRQVKLEPEPELYTTAERATLEAANAALRLSQAEYNRVLDARFEAEQAYYHPPDRCPPEMLVALARAHRDAIKAQEQATRELERCVAVVTDIKLAAQWRRREAAAAAITP